MKPGLMQVSVEVGRCLLPSLPYTEYSLSVHLSKEVFAATSFKQAVQTVVDFSTRLFLRTDKASLDATPNCSVVVSAITEKASKVEVARGEAKVTQEGRQQLRLAVRELPGSYLNAEVQFSTAIVEPKQTKTNNNRLSNFKSHLSQKQSSCDQKDSPASLAPANPSPNATFTSLKPTRSEKVLADRSVELETSANTLPHSGNVEENLNKSLDSDLLLHMQIKIDQLEHRAAALTHELANCQQRIRALTLNCEQERGKAEAERQRACDLAQMLQDQNSRSLHLEQSKQQLEQMLILEEEKNNISAKHIEKLTRLIESLACQQSEEFNAIQERDQIIMLNQELENQLTTKNITINQMKLQIEQLKQNIILLQAVSKQKKPLINETRPSQSKLNSDNKAAPASSKTIEIDKPKIQKRASEKIIQTHKKSEQQQHAKAKEIRKPKQKEAVKKELNIEPVLGKKPAVPKNPRQAKSPTVTVSKAEVTGLKAKVKSKPLLKIQQKTTIDSQKKGAQSSLTSMVSFETVSQAPNLMIHSRAQDNQPSKLQAS